MVASAQEARSPSTARRDRAGGEQVRDQSPAMAGGSLMTYQIKPLSCDPAKIKGMSERLIVSHYENNYGGAGGGPQPIHEQRPHRAYTKAPGGCLHRRQPHHPPPLHTTSRAEPCFPPP